jgi:hypothetical protein
MSVSAIQSNSNIIPTTQPKTSTSYNIKFDNSLGVTMYPVCENGKRGYSIPLVNWGKHKLNNDQRAALFDEIVALAKVSATDNAKQKFVTGAARDFFAPTAFFLPLAN